MIYTFYSYKGGVGRTMALANVGELFYQAGLNVLLVDWDLEAPGLERFFVDAEKITAHPGVVDMLLDYKHQMTEEWTTEAGQLPFKKPSDLFIDLHPDSPKGRLWLLTAGRRDKANFARYANAVLTFDWKDFYDNWEGEAYFEWLRQQFLEMADVVLIDSRTGITEMGGVCTYQLGDVIVMFCGTSQQNLDGTDQMVIELKSAAVENARGRPIKVVVIPARVEETAEKDFLKSFKNEFLTRFGVEEFPPGRGLVATAQEMWELTIPYVPFYAFSETVVAREDPRLRHEGMYRAFVRICAYLSLLAPDDSKIRQAIKAEEISPLGERRVAIGGDVRSNVIFMGGGAVISDDVYSGVFIRGDEIELSVQTLREAYLNRLLQSLGHLSLSGIDPKAAGEAEARLNLSAVYTALLTLTPEECDRLPRDNDSPEHLAHSAGRLSALSQLDRHGRLVLLGDPGTGKSAFLSFVALCLAGEAMGNPDINLARLTEPLPMEKEDNKDPEPQLWTHGALLPVRVVLRDFAARGLPLVGTRATARHLLDFIVTELEAAALGDYAPHLTPTLLREGGLLLLDGLDEVPKAERRREQVKQAVEDFAAAFPQCRILVTSRTYAYQQQAWRLTGFAEAVLAPFGAGQIERFVDRWYTHVAQLRGLPPEDAQGRAELLKRAIFGSNRLRALAERPLLLTLMASLHIWRGGSLPEKREELYADTVDLLLDLWESPKAVRDAEGRVAICQPSLVEWLRVDRDQVRALLELLAYQGHAKQPNLVGTADVLEGELLSGLMRLSQNPDVNPARLVEYLSTRAGLLLPRGVGVYTFPHRTFQEYLAACHLTDHGFPDDLADLLRADPQRWREATLLAGAKAARGTASAAWNLAEALCYRDPPPAGEPAILPDEADAWGALLAAQALLENERERLAQVSERNALKLERVCGWLLAIVMRGWLPPVDRALAGQALAVLGDPRDLDELVEVPAGPFLMGSRDDDERAQDREKPQHEVTLPAFKIGKYPVTNAQYLRFVQATGREWRSDEGRQPERATCLAAYVSWHDARAYCAWLTDVWRAEGRIVGDEAVRLPSEAEWEKAARGGLPSPSQGEGAGVRVYPWGDEWDETRCNTEELGLGSTTPVGIFPEAASPYGCLDMAGNVWEWTTSSWGKSLQRPEYDYPYDPTDGRENLDAGDDVYRVVRGGAFDIASNWARCSMRFAKYPSTRERTIGFRVVVVTRGSDW